MDSPPFERLLIDGDQLMFSVGFAAEEEPLNYILNTVKNSLNRTIRDTGNPPEVKVYIKGEDNFRDALAVSTGYKATRTARKPKCYGDIRRYLLDHWGAIAVDGMEADDAVSVELYQDWITGKPTTVLSSPDKDLWNTPGWHYNPKRPDDGVNLVTDEMADAHFWIQMLSGDRVDNIPGLPDLTKEIREEYGLAKGGKGCGELRAKTIIFQSDPPYSDIVQRCYQTWAEREGIEPIIKEYFEEQGRLLWMTRELHPDGSPVLWESTWK